MYGSGGKLSAATFVPDKDSAWYVANKLELIGVSRAERFQPHRKMTRWATCGPSWRKHFHTSGVGLSGLLLWVKNMDALPPARPSTQVRGLCP